MKPVNPNKPHLIIMVGIPGAGKSFFAEHFAVTFKAPIVSFDKIRQELFNNPTFNKTEDEVIIKIANYMLDEIFKTDQTVIYEGQTDQRNDRTAIAKKARDSGYEPLFIWVQTEPTTAKLRATNSKNILRLTIDQFNSKIKQFSIPHSTENTIVISGKHTYNSQLKIVLKSLITPISSSETLTLNKSPNTNRNILIR